MSLDKQNPQDSQGILRVADTGTVPDDPSANYSVVLTHAGPSDAVDTITRTLQGVSWRKTLSYTGSNLTSISAWVKL